MLNTAGDHAPAMQAFALSDCLVFCSATIATVARVSATVLFPASVLSGTLPVAASTTATAAITAVVEFIVELILQAADVFDQAAQRPRQA